MTNQVRRAKFEFLSRIRFRLPMLLTLTAIIVGWLGWQRHLVQTRAALLEWARNHGTWEIMTVSRVREVLPALRAEAAADYLYAPYEHVPQVSQVRRWMGDDAVAKIAFAEAPSAELRAEFRAAFPEADLEFDAQAYGPRVGR